ncbi:MAG: hypothetical protein AAF922_06435 [Pseudomonadota bacterium]
MTNIVALSLALFIAAGLSVDYVLFDLQGSLFLARKMLGLVEWLAFWR